ncbi:MULTISPECIES: WbuC family cupin fold metalloprotein [Providencia]|uniref:WbuC family cupin fold metalloprotein n=2 Tax=Morganellaceae TaxID=1903414 RepID=UPI001F03BDB7|nr:MULTISPECIES: WbuC family cupin fold metalloprotein [Providencia]MCG9942721.1 WbuC family cupin fold metalloprotein [Providencia rettgeri]
MKIYNNEVLNSYFIDAASNQRKRAHYNLHSSYNDKVQRLFITLVKGSYVEPHYHGLPHQWEMFIVINGTIKLTIYDPKTLGTQEFLIGDESSNRVIELFPNDIHSIECISDTALMLEIKEGPFDENSAKIPFVRGGVSEE